MHRKEGSANEIGGDDENVMGKMPPHKAY